MRSLTGKLIAFVVLTLAGASLSPAYGDVHSMVEEAHKDLQQALNPGGDTPIDADRTKLLKAAMDVLRDLPPLRYGLARSQAESYIRSALREIKNGDSAKATDDIREADSSVRDLEASS